MQAGNPIREDAAWVVIGDCERAAAGMSDYGAEQRSFADPAVSAGGGTVCTYYVRRRYAGSSRLDGAIDGYSSICHPI